jgi:hypothetical protein
MVIHNVKPIVVGVAFFFIALIAGATANDANAKQRYHQGYRCDNSQFCNRGYGAGNYHRRRGHHYNYNRRGWSYYAGVGLGGVYRYPYNYFGHGYGNPYFNYFGRGYRYPYYNNFYDDNFYDYYDTPNYYRRSSTVGRCGARWTKSWRRCCDAKYQSFNRGTGKYLTYSGRWKFCR